MSHDPLPNVGFRFARILLILSLVFLPFIAASDYLHGYILPAVAKGVVILVCLVSFYFSQNEKYQQLVRFGVASSLLLMATVGVFYKLDSNLGLMWVPVLPLLFCFLIGIRLGTIYTLIYFFAYLISYFAFEKLHDITPIDFSVWLLTLLAYVFVLVVTVLFQKEIEKEQQYLRDAAKYDYLTRILNRRGFMPRIEEEVARVNRYGGRLSLIMVDIDDFKGVNDKFGHSAGDSLLVSFAHLLTHHTRTSDLVARWGGEEFVVLAPNTSLKACEELAEKLRACVADNEFSSVGHVSSSFGVTQYQAGESWSDFLNRADNYLFEAKQSGKNQVVAKVDKAGDVQNLPPTIVA